MSIRSYKYRIRPNAQQQRLLGEMLSGFCALYNAGLQQRIEAYRRRGITLRASQQNAELTAIRAAEPDGIGRWSYSALGWVLRRLDQTYAAFFKRGRGFPRFRSAARYHSATYRFGDGLTIGKDHRLKVLGVPGGIKVVWHRKLPENGRRGTAILSRQQGKWYVIFSVEAEYAECCGTGTVGIDLGLNSLIATSDGETVKAPRLERKAHKAQRRRHRALARCQKGSKRRSKAKARLASGAAKIARQRRDHLHKLSRSLVSRYRSIAFEDLNMAGLRKGLFARSIHDAAWSTLVQFTTYKAESADASVVLVDPRGTSQNCPSCGTIKAKKLSERRHCCDCGCELDRDIAAAKIVHQRAFENGPRHGPQSPSQRNAA
ncbi:RNA-guided endonuclease InsQ/TnpB family protein [Methylobacterium pseudosasicola]|uniref:Putative transposase n=1 Tax=Methylobacterium pseudosasicola TaxID=582667 RepID=A0A1I4U0L6_9HYPH|nr:RNA-guided endonuclease TnpB family protein [Methylobacterium pseudosasicola]SFM82380.1 putative transposase [Methylobacterium pseudosasicola]